MSLNINNPVHRQRWARSVDHSSTELQKFVRMRGNTIQAYLGVNPFEPDFGGWTSKKSKYKKALPHGNLLQMAGLKHQIALAYGEPEFLATPRVPSHTGLAEKLEPALNRMSKLLNLGEIARAVAADSFFGYGIFKVGIGRLPLSAQAATGLQVGPCVWRVSQADFIYDITAAGWDSCAYVGDIYTMPLNEAQEIFPDSADRLATMTDTDRLDAFHVLARPTNAYAPEEAVLLYDAYLPGSKVIGTWPIRNGSFGTLADDPLAERDYEGHWSGIYEAFTHLYSPDELIPIAQAESVKAIHFLFNDILELTSNQARLAKVNPLYQAGADKDMKRIWDASDRVPVSVVDPSRFGRLEIEGPTQSQTAYMGALLQFFKLFVPGMDEPSRAPTATQGAMQRETTNAIIAEARRKFNRSLQLVGYKLGHLLINNNDLILPSYKPVMPGSNVTVDMSWLPSSMEPRVGAIDDFDINIEPYSTRLRSPEERQALLLQIIQQVTMIMQARAMGSPINVEKAIDILARYSGLPEVRELYEELLPAEMAQRQSSRQSSSMPRPGVGQYTRTNVSEKTTAGALEANLSQVGEENGSEPRME